MSDKQPQKEFDAKKAADDVLKQLGLENTEVPEDWKYITIVHKDGTEEKIEINRGKS